jgi:hypothetical protein
MGTERPTRHPTAPDSGCRLSIPLGRIEGSPARRLAPICALATCLYQARQTGRCRHVKRFYGRQANAIEPLAIARRLLWAWKPGPVIGSDPVGAGTAADAQEPWRARSARNALAGGSVLRPNMAGGGKTCALPPLH